MAKRKENISNISTTSNMSYEKYLKTALEMINPKLTVRSYKLTPKEEYPGFERGKDIRVVIFWDGKPATDIHGRKYEFVVEIPFWMGSNTNKEDRQWMRNYADTHIKIFKDAVQRGIDNSKKKKIKVKPPKKNIKVGQTQHKFEEMKKKK